MTTVRDIMTSQGDIQKEVEECRTSQDEALQSLTDLVRSQGEAATNAINEMNTGMSISLLHLYGNTHVM